MIATLISIYIVSFILSWLYVKLAFSKNGRYENLGTSWLEIFLCVMPLLNTMFLLYGYITHFPIKINDDFSADKFFGIKRDDN